MSKVDEFPKPVIFFDGACGLCNCFVRSAVKIAPGAFLYAPLQGATARRLLLPHEATDLTTVIIWKDGQKIYKSAAVLFVLSQGNLLLRTLARLMTIIPLNFRNVVYDYISQKRNFFFKKRAHCYMGTELQKYMLN